MSEGSDEEYMKYLSDKLDSLGEQIIKLNLQRNKYFSIILGLIKNSKFNLTYKGKLKLLYEIAEELHLNDTEFDDKFWLEITSTRNEIYADKIIKQILENLDDDLFENI